MTTSKTAVAMVTVAVSHDADGNESLIGVDRNGQVYRYQWARDPLQGQVIGGRQQYGPIHYWWSPLRMDLNKGPEPEIQQ